MANQVQESQKVYKYKKICKLPSCRKEFETNREWQNFCETSHQEEYWKLYRRSETDIRKELSELKKEQEKMKEKLGIK